jgi:hypothetical protein
VKRVLWNITLSSALTMAAYIALYAIWGGILSGIENEVLRLTIIALMTTAAFGFFFLYTSKIKKSIGEDELFSDYKEREYISLTDDFKLILNREVKALMSGLVARHKSFIFN